MTITKYAVTIFCVVVMLTSGTLFAQIRINEISAANASLLDEDMDLSDWIELHNSGTTAIDLRGYQIANRADISKSWQFPDTIIQPNGYLLVRASGKNRISSGCIAIEGTGTAMNGWNTLDECRFMYLPTDGDFDMSMRIHSLQKINAYTKIGLVLMDTIDVHNRHSGVFVTGRNVYLMSQRIERQVTPIQQEISEPITYPNVWMRLRRQGDSMFVYASQSGRLWKLIDSSRFVLTTGHGYAGILISSSDKIDDEPTWALVSAVRMRGEDIPLSELTGVELETPRAGAHYYIHEYHTDFKLDSDKEETVYLWDAEGKLIDSLSNVFAGTDVSCGHSADNTGAVYFDKPTPAAPNGIGLPLLDVNITCVPAGGIVPAGTRVQVTTTEKDAHVRYTLDGTEPTEESRVLMSQSLTIDTTTVVRLRLYKNGYKPSLILTHTYFVDEPATELPVFSLVSDPKYLWSDSLGILVKGNGTNPDERENFWQDWEIPCTVEMFEDDNSAFQFDGGGKVHGSIGSRFHAQKSLRFALRDRYSQGSLKHRLFPSESIGKFENFILRNAGNDWSRAFIRDPLMAIVSERIGLDVQAYRPARAYLNGQYWGLYQLRERIDENYLAEHYNIEADDIDLLENNMSVINGSADDYYKFIDSLSWLDMTSPDNIDFVSRHIDINNFIDYNCAEIYANNIDWPGNNVRFWKPKTPDSRWRWVLYDFDFGFGLTNDYTFNMLGYATSPEQTDWTNPPWATFLLRRFLSSESLKHLFINRFADLLNSEFTATKVIPLIDSLAAGIEPEIPLHSQRWEILKEWSQEVDILRDFATHRSEYVRGHIMEHFALDDTVQVTLNSNIPGAGIIRFSTLTHSSLPWSGTYFTNVPITATAIPAPGYKFVRWSIDNLPDSATITIELERSVKLTAIFAEDSGTNKIGVVINEIMYKPADDRDSKDWIELYNNSSTAVDLSQWTLKDDDDKHSFTIPSGTILPANGYIVLSNDVTAFRNIYPTEQVTVVGNISYGFGNPSDQVRLYDATGLLVDSVNYDSKAPWPTGASGTGRSIELLMASLDNTQGQNWRTSTSASGSPGRANGLETAVGGPSSPAVVLACYPNPLAGRATIYYEIDQPASVRLSLWDYLGREALVVYDREPLAIGEHSVMFAADNIAPGAYLLRMEVTSGAIRTTKVLPVVIVR